MFANRSNVYQIWYKCFKYDTVINYVQMYKCQNVFDNVNKNLSIKLYTSKCIFDLKH